MSAPDLSSYGEDVLRTAPDYVAYVPRGGAANDWTNQHFLVVRSWSGAFLAVWTQATFENNQDQRVVFARSDDGGVTWSEPRVVDGPSGDDGRLASWGFPVLAPELRRVYVFYTKNIGVVDVREDTTGLLAYKYSDDEGETWSERLSLPMERSAISPTDPATPENWICYQTPILNPRGEVTAGFTRWAGTGYHSESHLFQRHSECWFLRFENILTEADPARLRVSTWPRAPHGIRVPKPGDPAHSIAQEPAIQNLPDGRMICLMRTLTGYVWWSVSEDAGEVVVGGQSAAVCVGRAAGAASDFTVSALPAFGRALPADLPQQHRDGERGRGSARLQAEPASGVVQHRSGAGWGGGAAAGVQRAASADRQRRGGAAAGGSDAGGYLRQLL